MANERTLVTLEYNWQPLVTLDVHPAGGLPAIDLVGASPLYPGS